MKSLTENRNNDIWIVKGLYPEIFLRSVLGSDAVGHIVENGTIELPVGKRVLLNPGDGWAFDERGPEKNFRILGILPLSGTMTKESIVMEHQEIVVCPEHLSASEAAALPLAGLTAYRALFTKAHIQKGEHVLITGIGGGVALFALQFAVAVGAHVYVTSSSSENIQKAIRLGVKGGVNYKDENCMDELKKLLDGNLLSAIIDGAGGPLYAAYPRLMKQGGIISNYGQTANTDGITANTGITFTMSHVVKNIDLKGSTMGSRDEFRKMVEFVDENKIKPIVSYIWKGLNGTSVDQAFSMTSKGD